MNIADYIIIAVIGLCALISYHRGFVRALFDLTSLIITVFITYKLYPYFSVFLRNTFLFEQFKNFFMEHLHLMTPNEFSSLSQEIEFIRQLQLPKILIDQLVENNNYEVYNVLNVNGLNEYIAGYITNITINILSLIIVFIFVCIGLRLLISFLDILTMLPVIHSMNKLLGLGLGIITGVILTWIGFIIILPFYTNPTIQSFITKIEHSTFAIYLYHNNHLLRTVVDLFI